jgi:hypothetical protein
VAAERQVRANSGKPGKARSWRRRPANSMTWPKRRAGEPRFGRARSRASGRVARGPGSAGNIWKFFFPPIVVFQGVAGKRKSPQADAAPASAAIRRPRQGGARPRPGRAGWPPAGTGRETPPRLGANPRLRNCSHRGEIGPGPRTGLILLRFDRLEAGLRAFSLARRPRRVKHYFCKREYRGAGEGGAARISRPLRRRAFAAVAWRGASRGPPDPSAEPGISAQNG